MHKSFFESYKPLVHRETQSQMSMALYLKKIPQIRALEILLFFNLRLIHEWQKSCLGGQWIYGIYRRNVVPVFY